MAEQIESIIDSTLEDLYDRLENSDIDFEDIQFSDGKITLELANNLRYIINRQSATNQIWLAEPSQGWHFSYNDNTWVDDKQSKELYAVMEHLLTEATDQQVKL